MFAIILAFIQPSQASQPNEQLAIQHSLGLGLCRDYPQALVYASMGVLESSSLSHHLLGYWYEAGIGVPKQCQKSLYHYDYLAKINHKTFLKGFENVGGKHLDKPAQRLDTAGLYNEGKPSSKSLRNEDLLLLYKIQADGGDVVSQYMLGQVYYNGDDVERDFTVAMGYFRSAAKQYPTVGASDDQHSIKQAKIAASSACAFIGKMYIRGEGVDVDYGKGREWFERGAGQESPGCHTGLARIYIHGLGVEADYEKGLKYLNEASVLGDGSAKLLLALELEKTGSDYGAMMTLLDGARQKGISECYYHLGRILKHGYPNSPPNCKLALRYTKKWVEMTNWHDEHLKIAQVAYNAGDYDDALLNYLVAAETGLEVAQINAAVLLDEDKVNFQKLNYNASQGNLNRFDLALPLYLRAANQGNVDARVRAGGNFSI
jgi:SEL1 protein